MKSKKLIACLMALSIVGANSLMFGETAKAATSKAATINNEVKTGIGFYTPQTITGNNKGFNYEVSDDVYDNGHVSIKPEDYEKHTYKVDVRFEDDNHKILKRYEDTKNTLVYGHWFGGGYEWTRLVVFIYADDNLIDEVQIYRNYKE